MWDKAGVKQISPTGRQSPHTHNDSLNHPSYFTFLRESTAFQPPKRISTSHLLGWELNVSFIDSWSNLGWKGPRRSPGPTLFSEAQREALAGWTAEDHKVFRSDRGLSTPLVLIFTVGPSCTLDFEWKRHKGNTKENTLWKIYNRKPNCRK